MVVVVDPEQDYRASLIGSLVVVIAVVVAVVVVHMWWWCCFWCWLAMEVLLALVPG